AGGAVGQVVNQAGFGIHIGGDAEALFKPSDDFVTGVKSLTLGDRPELRIDPTNILTTGPIANVTGAQVYSVEAAANYGSLLVQGEYYFYNVDRASGLPSLKFNGGRLKGRWVLTRAAPAHYLCVK